MTEIQASRLKMQEKQPEEAVAVEIPTSPESEGPTPQSPLSPTRYGDWEINGKCVDF